jgi:hypothetical protein
MATKYNKIFSGYQPRQLAEWRKNQRFEDHLRPRLQGTEVAEFPMDGNLVGWLLFRHSTIQPIDAAGSPRRFY